MSVDLDEREAQNHSGPEGMGTALGFCAEGRERTAVTVEAAGSGVAWLFAVWPMGQLATGGGR